MNKMIQTISTYQRVLLAISIILGVLNTSLFKIIPHSKIGDYDLNNVVFYTSVFIVTIFMCLALYKKNDHSLFMYVIHFSLCITSAAFLVFIINLFIDELLIRNILNGSADDEVFHIRIPFFIYSLTSILGLIKPIMLWKKI